jgi:hypothetical protein
MPTPQRITSIQGLYDLINKIDRAGILESGDDYFIVECPNDANVTVTFNPDDDIDEIIQNTIGTFEDFDADEEFTELWSVEFARHNHFVPTQFISMLNADERFLRKTTFELRKIQFH